MICNAPGLRSEKGSRCVVEGPMLDGSGGQVPPEHTVPHWGATVDTVCLPDILSECLPERPARRGAEC